MAAGLPHLLNKDKDLSLEPQNPCKKDKVVNICLPTATKTEGAGGRSFREVCRLAVLTHKACLRLVLNKLEGSD